MSERLQKILAHAGVASRRASEALIVNGLVSVDGKIVTELGLKFDAQSVNIEVEGVPIKRPNLRAKKVVYMLYKPKSVVSTMNDPENRDCLANYLPPCKERLFPVGRLDYDAEGMILMTNDGELANNLMHPSKHVWKEYLVKLKGNIPENVMAKLRKGPVIEGKKHQPVKIKLLHYKGEKTWVSVALQEGIKHHIKLMFKEVGYFTLKIKRVRIGRLDVGILKSGESRLLTEDEVNLLSGSHGTK